MGRASVDWRRYSPAEREAYTKQQAGRILALDSPSRVQTLARMLATPIDAPEQALIQSVMRHMSDEEQRQVKETVGRELDRRKLNEHK